jgi:hypothetical protein
VRRAGPLFEKAGRAPAPCPRSLAGCPRLEGPCERTARKERTPQVSPPCHRSVGTSSCSSALCYLLLLLPFLQGGDVLPPATRFHGCGCYCFRGVSCSHMLQRAGMGLLAAPATMFATVRSSIALRVRAVDRRTSVCMSECVGLRD